MKFDNRKSCPTTEMLAARREFITKGAFITADCVVTTAYVKGARTESPLDEVSRRMKKVREMAEQLVATLRQQRH
jgi:hypothetical protein